MSELKKVIAESGCGPYANQTVTGSLSGRVWGSNPYTADSDFGAAVVHAGLATVGQTVAIQKTSPDFYSSFTGSTANGVTTLSYTAFCGHLISLTSLPPITYTSFVAVSDSGSGGSTLFEGQYTATFTLTTTGGAGRTVYWTTIGSVSLNSIMTADDFTDGQLQGTVLIGSNGIATITRSARADLLTEGNEVFALEIREGGYSDLVKITSTPSTGIVDTSTTPAVLPLSYTSFVGVTNASPETWYISESQYTATFTLTTTGGTPGQIVYWTTLAYSGDITAADFTDNTLEGSVAIAANGTTTITRTARADLTTESSEGFKLEIRESLGPSSAVKIVSTSSLAGGAIYIGDTSETPPASPTYAVAAPLGVTSVNEGIGLTFTVTTTNVANATLLYWSLSNTTDFFPSNGIVVISATGINGTGTFTVTPTADATTETDVETFTASISRTLGGTAEVTSASVTIIDTSQTPVVATHAVAAPAGVASVNEGSPITFTVTTTNVASGTLNWALSNTTDFVTSNGTVNITTTGINGTGTFTVTPTADLTTENTPETFTASVYTGSIAGTPLATSSSIAIIDSSQTPVSAITYVSLLGNTNVDIDYASEISPTYPATTTFVLTTTNAPVGKIIYWTTLPYVGTNITAADFTDNTLQGQATIGSDGTATIVRTVRADYTTESYEYYKLEIREDSYSSLVKIISEYVGIYDDSANISNVTVTPPLGVTSVDEGASLLFSVTTVGARDGAILYWSVSRPADFADTSGSFTITSNQGSFAVTPTADQSTELAAETFTVSVLSDPIGGLFSPTVFKTSDPITINDTSKTRSYTITYSGTSVNEGTAIEFIINTVNVPNNTQLFWSVSNSGDFSTSASSVNITTTGANGTATFSVTPVLDYVTETPAETFTASISLTLGGTAVYTTSAITINDILGQPVYTITPVATTVIEGQPLRFDVSTTNVPAGTELFWTVSTPVPVYVPPTPVYIITPAANSVDEGSSLRINVSGSNIPDDTYWWTIGTNSGDFGVTSGSFAISGNAGFFNVSPTADVTTESSPETFTVSVRPTSITTTPVVTTNQAITINDTSQAPPVPTYAVSTTPTSVNEGSPITFTVTTTNVANGTVLNWAVSNTSDFAISSDTVTITTTGINGIGTFSVTPRADATTENTPETFTASVYTGSITELPKATSGSIRINDTSQTPVAATYAVATSPLGITSVNEGTSITFNVTTTNISDGTSLNWAINNLLASSTADFTATDGSVIINGNTGSFTITPTADNATETVIEKFTVAIYTGVITGTPVATSNQITINDSSQTPPPPTYAIATFPAGITSVNEGASITFRVTTTSLPSPTTLYWKILTNTGDFTNSTGEVIVNNNIGTFSLTPTADATTESIPETFRVGIRALSIGASNDAESVDITIVDASQTPPPAPGYAVSPPAGITSVDEGSPITFTVTTTNVANGTLLYWAYRTGSADASDLTLDTGTFNINALGVGTFTVTPIADTTTEDSQTFSVSVRTGLAPATEVAYSISVIINDTSRTPIPPESATYAVASATSSVDEGSSIKFIVTTTNLVSGTPLYWSVNNAGEFGTGSGATSGIVTIDNTGMGEFTVIPIADSLDEGTETFRATIRSLSSGGDIEAISSPVIINDTSRAPIPPSPPTYSLIPAAVTVNEGDPLLFTVTTTNVAENTILSWSITNTGEFGISAGFVTIDNTGTGTFTVTPALDLITDGTKTFTASIFDQSNLVDPLATSSAVSIIDTSQGPTPPAAAEYFIVPAALSVNEGTPLIITVNTLNVAASTRLYWTVNGTVADFIETSGSVLINNAGTGSFSVTPTQDNVVEPAETFTISIRTALSNPPVSPVVTSNPITINAGVPLSQLFTTKITPAVYNNARTQVAGVLGVTTTGQVGATQGYGQVLESLPVAQHEKINESHLDKLRLDIVKTRTHQSGTDPNLVNVAIGNVALADVFDSYSVLAATCNTLKDQVGSNQLAFIDYTQTASYAAYTGSPNTGQGWKERASYETTITFATADAARYFFNAGSSFKFSASRTGGTVLPTVGLNQNVSWTNLLDAVSTENPAFVKNNFYALGTAYSTFYNKNSAGIYSANYYRITAKCNVADNSYGGATVITFNVEFVDVFNNDKPTNYDGVDGTLTSIIRRSMPKGLGLEGALSVAAPTSIVHNPSDGFIKVGAPVYKTATYSIVATPTSVSEAGATINFTFTATNYNPINSDTNLPNTVTWTIAATTLIGLSDFVLAGSGWTSSTNDLGYQVINKVTSLTPTSTFEASITTASIVTNPDALTEGTESFVVFATPTQDGSGGGLDSETVTITVTDSSKTATPGYSITPPTVVGGAAELSCIPGEGLGAAATWTINSVALTGAAPLVIYGIYLDISANSNINAYSITLWDGTVLTETTTTYYTLPTSKSVANGANVTFTVRVGSTSGGTGAGTVNIRFRTNAGSIDGSGPNVVGPSYNQVSRSVSVRVVAPSLTLSISASPPSVSYNYVAGQTGTRSITVTVTNTGNVRATLSNYNVSNPGGGSVNQGLISGLLLPGDLASTTVTYSATSAYSGISNISISGSNTYTVTASPNINVSVTAVQAFGIISQSITGTTSAVINSQQTFNVVISNSGLAPLSVSSVVFGGVTGSFMTVGTNPSFPTVIGPGGSQQYMYTWSRSRIGSSSVTASITSNTGGTAGTTTSAFATFYGTATVPTFILTGSGPGMVVGTNWLSNDGVLPKEGKVRLEFAGLEPNTNCSAAMFWTEDQTQIGTGGKGVWATSAETRGSLITDPKLVPITENVTSSTGTYIPWPGTGPNAGDGFGAFETRYWRAGRNRFYVQLPVGKNDAGVQQWYTNSRSGTSAAAPGQWATNTATPEAPCGSNQTWIGFTVALNVQWTLSNYQPISGENVTYTLSGASSQTNFPIRAVSYSVDIYTFTGPSTSVPWNPYNVTTDNTGSASGTIYTGVTGPFGPQQAPYIGTYNSLRPITVPTGSSFAGGSVEGNAVTFDVRSPAFYVVSDIGLDPQWGVGSAVSPNGTAAEVAAGTYEYFRRIPSAGNGTYTGILIKAACDDILEIRCQGILLLNGNITQNPFSIDNQIITINDGFSHWRFTFTNGGATGPGNPGWFAVAVYIKAGAILNLYFATSSVPAGLPPVSAASKW